jgi:hypothetical protein
VKKNVIILTSGLSGSSVLAALIAQDGGYWLGDSTIKKSDYDTWENAELVELNKRILADVGFTEDWTMHFQPEYIDRVTQAAATLDPSPYQNFVKKCETKAPWLWKDPRLWLTIRYWQQHLDLDRVAFLLIHRDPMQSWISTTLRRQIQTMKHAYAYEEGINKSLTGFLAANNAPFINILYEDLLVQPDATIETINRHLETHLELDDLKQVFRGRLHKRQHGLMSFIKAMAIYLKNHAERCH